MVTEVPAANGAACRLPPAGGFRLYPGSLLPAGALTTALKRPAVERSLTPSCVTVAVVTGLQTLESGSATGLRLCCSAAREVAVGMIAGFALPKLRTGGPAIVALGGRRRSTLAPSSEATVDNTGERDIFAVPLLVLAPLPWLSPLPQHASTTTLEIAATVTARTGATGGCAAMNAAECET